MSEVDNSNSNKNINTSVSFIDKVKKIFSIDNLKKWQAASGVVISTFSQLHIVMVLGSHLGELCFTGLRDLFRQFYQNKFIEPIIIGAIGTHIVVNGILFYKRDPSVPVIEMMDVDPSGEKKSWLSKFVNRVPTPYGLFQASGLILSVFIGGHVFATRGYVLLDKQFSSGFKSVHYTLINFPYYFYPYYGSFFHALMYHTAFSYNRIYNRYIKRSHDYKVNEVKSKSYWYGVYGVTGIVALSAILALGGNYFPVSKIGIPPPLTISQYLSKFGEYNRN
ncbi:hypothetical protein PPL_10389 [Heterostelium album PN500]|uniref:Uncharacterized protein n=1 Tax=Heterostelium pallidum (strain ATCC 26659 / Pp 5 / PN500) TaxID=670386 RepID=D3BQY6_HETP5|nr:hypothetical protein PPL_10389 [Heterostelium album PN500]EFA76172.1 hypothetical protein PPL_10389 [Heterostelium album PN500]|eukprot:XP_020428305.1 hypothetical protein PPL_10389 [Heterostelium album PN500]